MSFRKLVFLLPLMLCSTYSHADSWCEINEYVIRFGPRVICIPTEFQIDLKSVEKNEIVARNFYGISDVNAKGTVDRTSMRIKNGGVRAEPSIRYKYSKCGKWMVAQRVLDRDLGMFLFSAKSEGVSFEYIGSNIKTMKSVIRHLDFGEGCIP